MNGFDLSTISGLYIGSAPYSAIYKGSVNIWEATPNLKYLTIESLEDDNDISINSTGTYAPENYIKTLYTIEYSTDKVNWTSKKTYRNNAYYTPKIITLNRGQKLYLRSTNKSSNTYINIKETTDRYYNYFSTTKNFKIYGNIMSLCYGDNFVNQTTLPWTYTFYYLFKNCTKLVDTSNLILPATTLDNYCYYNMFYGCSSLTTAPELPATTLKLCCYMSMFKNCTSLTTAPSLPATTLQVQCYQSMFYGCTSLTTAPSLPATRLELQCYYQMFYDCTLLNYVKALFTTDISSNTTYTENWLYNVAATGTFVKHIDSTISTGTSGIPSGWTIQEIDPTMSDNASIKVYVQSEGTTNYTFRYNIGSNTTKTGNNTIGISSGNNKYYSLKSNGVSAGYAYVVNNIVITGFSKFKMFIKTYQSSGNDDILAVNILNDDTNIGNIASSDIKSNPHVYAWQDNKGNYSTGGDSTGVQIVFDNLNPTEKYNIRLLFRGTSKNTQYILFPSSYPIPIKDNSTFTSSSDYTDIYGS